MIRTNDTIELLLASISRKMDFWLSTSPLLGVLRLKL